MNSADDGSIIYLQLSYFTSYTMTLGIFKIFESIR
jgi:hypothetical protein